MKVIFYIKKPGETHAVSPVTNAPASFREFPYTGNIEDLLRQTGEGPSVIAVMADSYF